MRLVLQDRRTGKVEVADAPAPLLQANGVLVRNAFSVISPGTERASLELSRRSLLGKAMARPDQVRTLVEVARREGTGAALRRAQARLDERTPLGYSSAGVVLEVGAHVSGDFLPGQRVACGGAEFAHHAEIVYVPRNLCVPVPDGVSLEDAAFATIGSIALHAVRQADIGIGGQVAVIGLGLVGQIAVQLLRAAGCRVMGIDTDPARCAMAREHGAEIAVAPSDARDAARNRVPHGFDAVVIAAATSSNAPLELAAEISRDRAKIVAVGAVRLDVPREIFYRKELDLRLSRSYGPGRYDAGYEERGNDYPIGYVRWTEHRNMQAFLDLLAGRSLAIASLISRRFALDEAPQAYDLLDDSSAERPLGIVFSYSPQSAITPRVTSIRTSTTTTARGRGIGFVGSGHHATAVLLPLLREVAGNRLQLTGVATVRSASASNVMRRYGFGFATADPQALLDDRDTAAVVIATRHDQHADLVAGALRAGKHVFVEKPLALNREELREVVRAHASTDRFVLVGFNRRHAPLAKKLKEHFADRHSAMSVLVRVNAGPVPRDHWTQDLKEGGGRIVGEACHFVDLMQYLTASVPTEVDAHTLPNEDVYSGDNLVSVIRFSDGSLGTLLYMANGDVSMPKERIEVTSAGRSAVLEDFRELLTSADGKRKRIRSRNQDKGHRDELVAFVESLSAGSVPSPSLADSAITTLTTIAIVESASRGSRVRVDLGDLTTSDAATT